MIFINNLKKLQKLYYVYSFNPVTDECFHTLHRRHQRFFLPDQGCEFEPFKAKNVGLFTAYEDFKDLTAQFLDIIGKPVIYLLSIAIIGYFISHTIVDLFETLITTPFDELNFTEELKKCLIIVLACIAGIIHVALSLVTEPVFSALGLFTRALGNLFDIFFKNKEETHQKLEEPVKQTTQDDAQQDEEAQDQDIDSLSLNWGLALT